MTSRALGHCLSGFAFATGFLFILVFLFHSPSLVLEYSQEYTSENITFYSSRFVVKAKDCS